MVAIDVEDVNPLLAPEMSRRLLYDDLLDDLGKLVEKLGDRVLVLPAEWISKRTGLTTTYRIEPTTLIKRTPCRSKSTPTVTSKVMGHWPLRSVT